MVVNGYSTNITIITQNPKYLSGLLAVAPVLDF
jgi:hypothetical protein